MIIERRPGQLSPLTVIQGRRRRRPHASGLARSLSPGEFDESGKRQRNRAWYPSRMASMAVP